MLWNTYKNGTKRPRRVESTSLCTSLVLAVLLAVGRRGRYRLAKCWDMSEIKRYGAVCSSSLWKATIMKSWT